MAKIRRASYFRMNLPPTKPLSIENQFDRLHGLSAVSAHRLGYVMRRASLPGERWLPL